LKIPNGQPEAVAWKNGQKIQLPKEKELQNINSGRQNNTQKTKDWVTRTQQKRGEIKCSIGGSSS